MGDKDTSLKSIQEVKNTKDKQIKLKESPKLVEEMEDRRTPDPEHDNPISEKSNPKLISNTEMTSNENRTTGESNQVSDPKDENVAIVDKISKRDFSSGNKKSQKNPKPQNMKTRTDTDSERIPVSRKPEERPKNQNTENEPIRNFQTPNLKLIKNKNHRVFKPIIQSVVQARDTSKDKYSECHTKVDAKAHKANKSVSLYKSSVTYSSDVPDLAEVNLLKKLLADSQEEKIQLKRKLYELDDNIQDIRHKLAVLMNKTNNSHLHRNENKNNMETIEFLKKINEEKIMRESSHYEKEERQRQRDESLKMQMEARENEIRQKINSERKKKILENIENIKKRHNDRLRFGKEENKVMQLLLNSKIVTSKLN